MYVESGYLIKTDDETEIVFVEIKKNTTSMTHNFYEIVYKPKTDSFTCREVSNPIEYMEKAKHMNINRIDDQEQLKRYIDDLYSIGIVTHGNEIKVSKSRSFSLKNEEYDISKRGNI